MQPCTPLIFGQISETNIQKINFKKTSVVLINGLSQ